jgi:hypothetical protein
MNIFLVIFLLVDVLMIGIFAPMAIRHAQAHFWHKKQEGTGGTKQHGAVQNGHLPPSIREHLLEEAQRNFQHVLDTSAKELQQDLAGTTLEIHKLVEKMGTEAVASELENYRTRLAELQKKTEEDMAGMRETIAAQQEELKAKVAADIQAEKQRLLSQIDTRLGDAVTSFLLDAMQYEVDLGAQGPYLTKLLEAHKDEFKKEVSDETKVE